LSFQYFVPIPRSLLDNLVLLLNFSTAVGYASELKVVFIPANAVTGDFELCCQHMVKVGLVESAIAHRVSHFQGFPFFSTSSKVAFIAKT
jgi:hypothetical protein